MALVDELVRQRRSTYEFYKLKEKIMTYINKVDCVDEFKRHSRVKLVFFILLLND
jgi:hypothetical protein